MLVKDLEFPYRPELRALGPLPVRGFGAKMLVLHKATGKIEHRKLTDLPEYLAGDEVWVNNSKLQQTAIELYSERGHVVKADLFRQNSPTRWRCYLRIGKDVAEQCAFMTVDGIPVKVVGGSEKTYWVVEFERPPDFGKIGKLLLHPGLADIIAKKPPSTPEEEARFEPLYAKVPGGSLSPTGGVNLTQPILDAIKPKELTHHIDMSVVYTMTHENVEYHAGFLRTEPYWIPEAPSEQGIAAIGTTVVRSMETWARTGKLSGEADLFISPGFEFKVAKKFLTNFHYPREVLLAMACAFGGTKAVLKAYGEATDRRYRWGDYGDSMLMI